LACYGVNRNRIDEKTFAQIEAGLIKRTLLKYVTMCMGVIY